MQDRNMKIRRGKRTDFPAILQLLTPEAPADINKAQVRHWRRLASDLSHDFYVAERGGAILGILLVGYIRSLKHPGWQAILDLVVSPPEAHATGQALLTFAKARAHKRGCQHLFVCRIHTEHEQFVLLAQAGFYRAGEVLSCELL